HVPVGIDPIGFNKGSETTKRFFKVYSCNILEATSSMWTCKIEDKLNLRERKDEIVDEIQTALIANLIKNEYAEQIVRPAIINCMKSSISRNWNVKLAEMRKSIYKITGIQKPGPSAARSRVKGKFVLTQVDVNDTSETAGEQRSILSLEERFFSSGGSLLELGVDV
ncbi:MAG: hypothetical protein H0U27_05200, partial [Nitrosopumilus sp.]|nr:hypothetical protein [Nitrosopumilus sp.]